MPGLLGLGTGNNFGSLPDSGKVAQPQEMVEKLGEVCEGFAGEVAQH